MGHTLIEKILGAHAGRLVAPGDIVDIDIDIRAARDFGGANVVKNLKDAGLGIADAKRTVFTFDCNPTGSDQKYAANQHACRLFAREHGVPVLDIDQGIGTHLAIDRGLVGPGATFVSTDSHANILGAIGAFGQGMGDIDIAATFARGRIWFQVPPSVKVILEGAPGAAATPKDIVLALLKRFGANGLLGLAAELGGEPIERLSLDGRITVASMATEMGAIILLIPPSDEVVAHCRKAGATFTAQQADADAVYQETITVSLAGLGPMISRPGHPEDVVLVAEVAGAPIDSAFIGSCTNGRMEDLRAAAAILRGRKVAPGIVLKIVPATDAIWRQALAEGLIEVFKAAGALVGNAGCAGCAAGQIGMNGPGETTLSTGNRNFAGKQGQGKVWLASPAVVAAAAVAGAIVLPDQIPDKPAARPAVTGERKAAAAVARGARPTRFKGRVWLVAKDNIDTDMIFHNRHLAITDQKEMGQHAFGNLPGFESFARQVRPGDIVVTGKNFGCGSSRQQAVDCFASLGCGAVIAQSFGAIYERNAINSGYPILVADVVANLGDGEVVEVDFVAGTVRRADGTLLQGRPFPEVQLEIYQRGGLLSA